MILRTHKPNICRKDRIFYNRGKTSWFGPAWLSREPAGLHVLRGGRVPKCIEKNLVDNVCRPAETLQKCGDTTGQWPPNTGAKSASKPQPNRDTMNRFNAVPLLCFYHHFTKAYSTINICIKYDLKSLLGWVNAGTTGFGGWPNLCFTTLETCCFSLSASIYSNVFLMKHLSNLMVLLHIIIHKQMHAWQPVYSNMR